MSKLQPAAPDVIRIVRAREHNLKNVTLDIPKRQITVFTGVSGSGKSSLVFDTVAAESQRQLNETFPAFVRHRLPHYGQPDVDLLHNLSVAIVIDQKRLGGNARSTVGTVTDIHALLRLLYSRAGRPGIGESSVFSFNHPEGMCPRCQGLGLVTQVDPEKLVARSRSLNEGGLASPVFAVGGYRWSRYARSGLFDPDKKLEDYSKAEWQLLMFQPEMILKDPPRNWPRHAKYEGVVPRFERTYVAKDAERLKPRERAALTAAVTRGTCPACRGYRLNRKVLSCRINGRHIGQCSALQVTDLIDVIRQINDVSVRTVTASIIERLGALMAIGLGYLSLDRHTGTLSGGESQRVKMIRHLGSSLTGLTYILDEPSTGLHPQDVHQLNELIQQLRDKGNTVLVVEHDPDVIAIADHVVDMGPGAGTHGGQIVFQGTAEALRSAPSVTGRCLSRQPKLKDDPRSPQGYLSIHNATMHNLQKVNAEFPCGVLTVVTGVAGSGKSSLVNGELTARYPEIVSIDQGALVGSSRSNMATYLGVMDSIRRLFAQANGVSSSMFSSNSAGACPVCKGLGEVHLDLAFMDSVISICEACRGRRFTDEVLSMRYRGRNIDEVLRLTADDALELFQHDALIYRPLRRAVEVGLSYLTLGQPLSTLSGGERQRVKLATELGNSGRIYILDEPTTGLHMSDVDRLQALLDRLVDAGNTVIVIEHNLAVIARADWVIDMGPGAGHGGGRIVTQGPPAKVCAFHGSSTAQYLKRYITRQNLRTDSLNSRRVSPAITGHDA
jgi:excinuclease UvrABC ATPase subunit